MFLEKYFLSCFTFSNRSFFFSDKFYFAFLLITSRPIRFKVSVNKECLIFLSIGEDELKEGQTLTSIIHGFKLLSIRISNPYNSNPQFLFYWVFEWISSMTGSAAIQVFIRMLFIYPHNYNKQKFYFLIIYSCGLIIFS